MPFICGSRCCLGLGDILSLIECSSRVPLSTSFGRRPVYIASSLICLASNIWRAKAQTYSSFMGACVLNGIGAGPAEVGLNDVSNSRAIL